MTIGLCHGVFDLFHIGHLDYLKFAKQKCDILVVSVTADKYVNKGPGRPFFNLKKRIELLKSIDCVDFVIPSNNLTSINIIKKLKPNYYFKGPDYKDLNKDITKNIILEKKAVQSVDGKLINTAGQIFSASNFSFSG